MTTDEKKVDELMTPFAKEFAIHIGKFLRSVVEDDAEFKVGRPSP